MLKFTFILLLLGLSYQAQSAIPSIQSIADQRTAAGVYSFTPTLAAGENVLWTKAYGPDDVKIDPITGTTSWSVPAGMPDESFHLGLRASNDDGNDIETWILTVGSGEVVYIGPSEVLKTLKAGMAAIDSGDTLVMRNGTWAAQGGDNTIPGSPQKFQKLPEGDASQYTSLMAEDPGQVIIDGSGYTQSGLISLFGSYEHPDWGPLNTGSSFTGLTDYIAIKGLVLTNSWTDSLRINYSHHIKLIDIGVGPSGLSEGSYPNVYIYRSDHVLIEGMYVWGHGRYKIQFKDSSESVVRRSVVRMDDIRIDDPIGGFIAYCSKNIVFQNNIVIDSDSSQFWFDHNTLVGAYGVPATNCYSYPEGIIFEDSLVLNSHVGVALSDARETTNDALWQNIVAWSLQPARSYEGDAGASTAPIHSGVGPTALNRLTVGEVSTSPSWFLYSRSQDTSVTNSILHRLGWNGSQVNNIGDLIRVTGATFYFSHNNVSEFLGDMIQSGSPVISNTTNHAPNFRYITKLPDSSNLRSLGENSQGVGAEILMMRGKSGTHYGTNGYRDVLDIPMWPFPGEEQMHSHFGQFSYTGPVQAGGTGTLNGKRGFAVDNQSLTHYVWTFLDTIAPPFRVRAVPQDGAAIVLWQAKQGLGYAATKYRIYRTDVTPHQYLGEQMAASANQFRVNNLPNNNEVSLGVSAVASNGTESDIVYAASVTPSDGTPVIVDPVDPIDDASDCYVIKGANSKVVSFCL